LPHAVELGRSFVQRQYWNSNTLEFLWAGIGTVLSQRGGTRYLFGPVSISKNYPPEAQEAIVYVYRKWFGADRQLARSVKPYRILPQRASHLREYFSGKDLSEDLNRLKLRLRPFGVTIPMLFRQYTELCAPEGVRIHDFGLDVSFGSCIDAFIVLDLAYLSEAKRERYISRYRGTLRYAPSFPLQTPAEYVLHEEPLQHTGVRGQRFP
jgi:hypothetical protein